MREIRKLDYSRTGNRQLQATLKKKLQAGKKDQKIKQILEELSKRPKNTLRDIINREIINFSKTKPKYKMDINYVSNRDIVKKFKQARENKTQPKKNKMDINYIINKVSNRYIVKKFKEARENKTQPKKNKMDINYIINKTKPKKSMMDIKNIINKDSNSNRDIIKKFKESRNYYKY